MTITTDLAPSAFMRLTGHPLRWRLLEELARSDRRVHELTELVGEPQSLVSYHLGQLRGGRLISTRRSSADRRDAYYMVDLTRLGELLAATGAAIHPGLRLTRSDPDTVGPRAARKRVLFLCTGNSARSQMAEALARARCGGVIEPHSAGSQPRPLHANAVRVMDEEYGIDMADQRAKHLNEFAEQRFDRVVSLCDRIREVCPEFSGRPETSHWSLPDPTAEPGDHQTTYPLFQKTAAELETRIGFLVAGLAEASTPQEEPR